MMIKVNDGLFVLVTDKNEDCPFSVLQIGDKVIANGKIDILLQNEDFPSIIMDNWVGFVWDTAVDNIDGLFHIGWDEDTILNKVPDDFKIHCCSLQLGLDMIVIDEENLELFPES